MDGPGLHSGPHSCGRPGPMAEATTQPASTPRGLGTQQAQRPPGSSTLDAVPYFCIGRGGRKNDPVMASLPRRRLFAFVGAKGTFLPAPPSVAKGRAMTKLEMSQGEAKAGRFKKSFYVQLLSNPRRKAKHNKTKP